MLSGSDEELIEIGFSTAWLGFDKRCQLKWKLAVPVGMRGDGHF